jgi:hypothetical protein
MKRILKTLGVVFFALVSIVATNLLTTVILYMAWNWGLVGAVTFVNPIGLLQAFFLGLLLSVAIYKAD